MHFSLRRRHTPSEAFWVGSDYMQIITNAAKYKMYEKPVPIELCVRKNNRQMQFVIIKFI